MQMLQIFIFLVFLNLSLDFMNNDESQGLPILSTFQFFCLFLLDVS